MQNQWIVIVAFAAVAILVLGIRTLVSKDKTQRTASLVAFAVLALTAALSLATLTSQTSTVIGIVLAALCLILPTAAYVLTVMMINRSNRNAEAERYFEDVILGISDVPDTVVETDDSISEEELAAAVKQSDVARQKTSNASVVAEAEEADIAAKPEKQRKRRRFGDGKKRAEKAAEKEAAAVLAEEAEQRKQEEAAKQTVKAAEQTQSAVSVSEPAPQQTTEVEAQPHQAVEAPVVAAAAGEAVRAEELKVPASRLVEKPVAPVETAMQAEAAQLNEAKAAEPAVNEAPSTRLVEQPVVSPTPTEQTGFAEKPAEVETASVVQTEEPEATAAQVVEDTVVEETFVIPQSARRDSVETLTNQESDDIYKALRAMVDRNTAALTKPQESASQADRTMPFSAVKDALVEQYARADATSVPVSVEQSSEVNPVTAEPTTGAEVAAVETAAETTTTPAGYTIREEKAPTEQPAVVETAPSAQPAPVEAAPVEQSEVGEPALIEQETQVAAVSAEHVSDVKSAAVEQTPAVEPVSSEHYTVIADYEPVATGATIKEVYLNEQPEPVAHDTAQPVEEQQTVAQEAAQVAVAQDTLRQEAVAQEAALQDTPTQQTPNATTQEEVQQTAAQVAASQIVERLTEQAPVVQEEAVQSTGREVYAQPEATAQPVPAQPATQPEITERIAAKPEAEDLIVSKPKVEERTEAQPYPEERRQAQPPVQKTVAQPAAYSAPRKVEEQPAIKQTEVEPQVEKTPPYSEAAQQAEPKPAMPQVEAQPVTSYVDDQVDQQEVETHSVVVQTDPVMQLEISFDKQETAQSAGDSAHPHTPTAQTKSESDKTSDVDLSYQIKAQAFEKKKLYGIAARLYEESAYRTSNNAHTESALVSAMNCYLKDGRLIDAKAIASGLEGQMDTLSEEAATAVKTILQMPM